jgi:hypothetical protein
MDLMMSSVIVKNMVDLNILKVDEGHNLPHVTIMDRGKVCMKLLRLHKKKTFNFGNIMGFVGTFLIKKL